MSPLSCRVTISGQRYEIPTKLHLRSESWSAVAQKSLGKTANDKEVNRYIEDLKITIEDTIAKIRQKSYPLNIENFKLMFGHRIMSSLRSAHCSTTMKSWRKRISVPVHLLAITSRKNICSISYALNTTFPIMTWLLLTKHSFMNFTPIFKGIGGRGYRMRSQWCIKAYPAFQKGDECSLAKRMDKPKPCLPAQCQENKSGKGIPLRKGTEKP